MKSFKFGWLLIAVLISTSQVFGFSDIAADDPNLFMYQHLQDVNIMTPLTDGAFHPEIIITKSQALTFALRAGDISIPADFEAGTLPLDVNPNEWYAKVVARAQALKIISQKDFFAPDAPVTKAEFLAFVFRSAQIKTYKEWDQNESIANDINPDNWFAPDFWYAKKYHIAHADQYNNYLPIATINRQQAAVILYRHLRIFHGGESVKLFAELQGQMQTFMTKLKQGEEEAAMIHLQAIKNLSRKIATVKNDKNAIAAKFLAKSFDNLILSLRAFRYQQNLRALEYINLSIHFADKASEKSETIKPVAAEMQNIITETLMSSAL